SYYYKAQKGVTWSQNFKHIALRCVKLFLFGVALHCIYAGRLVWELWNVLTQLSITTMIAYLIIRKSNVFRRTDFLLTTSVARQPGPLLYPGPSQVLVTAR
ncbi:MAG TPA: DUF5009 domain-containing protein, partial [Flavisolibacter sp.]